MKFLLTSAGIINKSLENTLSRLIKGKIRIVFIPTAAMEEKGPKPWLERNIKQCRKFGEVEVVDISSLILSLNVVKTSINSSIALK